MYCRIKSSLANNDLVSGSKITKRKTKMTSKQLQEIAGDIIKRGIQSSWTEHASDYGYFAIIEGEAFTIIPAEDERLINIQLNYMGAIKLPQD